MENQIFWKIMKNFKNNENFQKLYSEYRIRYHLLLRRRKRNSSVTRSHVRNERKRRKKEREEFILVNRFVWELIILVWGGIQQQKGPYAVVRPEPLRTTARIQGWLSFIVRTTRTGTQVIDPRTRLEAIKFISKKTAHAGSKQVRAQDR